MFFDGFSERGARTCGGKTQRKARSRAFHLRPRPATSLLIRRLFVLLPTSARTHTDRVPALRLTPSAKSAKPQHRQIATPQIAPTWLSQISPPSSQPWVSAHILDNMRPARLTHHYSSAEPGFDTKHCDTATGAAESTTSCGIPRRNAFATSQCSSLECIPPSTHEQW